LLDIERSVGLIGLVEYIGSVLQLIYLQFNRWMWCYLSAGCDDVVMVPESILQLHE